MKGKQLAILLILVVVLGGAWFFKSKQNTASWSDKSTGAGGKVVEFPINDVARLVIKTADGELNLVKKDDVWTVKERADYPANFEGIGTLLRKLWELKTVQEVKVGPSQFARLELDEKTATVVTFQDKDGKAIGGVLLGKQHMRESDGESAFPGAPSGFAVGRYVKSASDAKVSLVSETLDEVQAKPENWIAKDFLKIEGPKSIAVVGPQTWSVTRENASAEWKLADAKPDEKLDTAKASPLSSVWSGPSFTDVKAPDAKLEDPKTTATIETFDGFRYELTIGKPDGDNYPVLVKVTGNFPKERTPGKDEKPEDKTKLDGEFAVKLKGLEEKLAKEKKFEGRAFVVAKHVVDPLLKERTALLPDKPAEPATPPAPAPGAAPSPVAPSAPVSVTTPPVTSPAPKMEAVTPPVAVPPAPARPTAPAPAPKPATPKPAAPNAAAPAKAPAPPAPAATPTPAKAN